MKAKCGALAVFSKTVEISAVKSRLAQTIGQEAANKFYSLSLAATQAIVSEVIKLEPSLSPYWAVAEKEGLTYSFWQSFNRISQGSGSLGERLNRVYRELLGNYDYVIFIGGDSPHLQPHNISHAARLLILKKCDFTIGNTLDGGYYLFGGRKILAAEAWTQIPYSTSKTAALMAHALKTKGLVQEIPTSFDIDTIDDLKYLKNQWDVNLGGLNPQQICLYHYVGEILKSKA